MSNCNPILKRNDSYRFDIFVEIVDRSHNKGHHDYKPFIKFIDYKLDHFSIQIEYSDKRPSINRKDILQLPDDFSYEARLSFDVCPAVKIRFDAELWETS